MQATLKEPDDVGVPGDARAGRVAQRLREILPGARAERLAGAKPEQRVRREALPEGAERVVVPVRRLEDAAIQRVAIHERLAPFAVTPELELADGLVRSVAGEEAERAAKVSRAVRGVDSIERAVQVDRKSTRLHSS